VVVDNDVNVGAWGEYRLGAGRGFQDLMAVFVGTGIGGGLVLGGKLYHGHYFTAGEIGHTVSLPHNGLGRRSLENLASRTNVVNQLVGLIQVGHESRIKEITKGDLTQIRSKVLAEAVKKKDKLACEVIRDSARYVGAMVANMVTMLSLPCAVIGGGMPEALGETYVKWVREAFEEFVFPPQLKACKLVAAELGDHAGAIGAALLVREKRA